MLKGHFAEKGSGKNHGFAVRSLVERQTRHAPQNNMGVSAHSHGAKANYLVRIETVNRNTVHGTTRNTNIYIYIYYSKYLCM